MKKQITVLDIQEKKRRGEKITMLTAYDALFAEILDKTNLDMILVGDSLGMVGLGYRDTLPVTIDMMVHHTRAVTRAVRRVMVVSDMPFLTAKVSEEDALRNAGRLFQEGRAQAVKVEGADPGTLKSIKRIVEAGLPVMGHIGLVPQSVHALGGYHLQGRGEEEGKKLMTQATRLVDAGVFSLILETVPRTLAQKIARSISIPVIGIGAGNQVDGQVLVTADLLGLFDRFHPRFVKKYAELHTLTTDAIQRYIEEVHGGDFPDTEHSFE